MTFKSCPFCDADSHHIHESPSSLIATWVECSQCHAHSRTVIANKPEATKAAKESWNRRPNKVSKHKLSTNEKPS